MQPSRAIPMTAACTILCESVVSDMYSLSVRGVRAGNLDAAHQFLAYLKTLRAISRGEQIGPRLLSTKDAATRKNVRRS